MDTLLDLTTSLDFPAHESVVHMLKPPDDAHVPIYENLLQYPCTDRATDRLAARNALLQDPVASAFLYRWGWPTLRLRLRYRYGLSPQSVEQLLHIVNYSASHLFRFPYLAAYALDGHHLTFSDLDHFADYHHLAASDPERIHAAVFWAVQQQVFDHHHVRFPVAQIHKQANKMLEAYGELYPHSTFGRLIQRGGFQVAIQSAWNDLCKTHYTWDVVSKTGQHLGSITRVYYATQSSGQSAAQLVQAAPQPPLTDIAPFIQQLAAPPYALDARQQAIVEQVLQRRLTLIHGGPGRGKTHLIASLIHALEHTPTPPTVWVISPTARGALNVRAMTESLLRNSTDALTHTTFLTVHKALRATATTDGRPRQIILPDLVILDEASMLDALLARPLFEAVALSHSRLVIVGDAAQLPPVGIGRVLRNMLQHTQNQSASAVQTLSHDYRHTHNPINPVLDTLRQLVEITDGLQALPSGVIRTSDITQPNGFPQWRQQVLDQAMHSLRTASTMHWTVSLPLADFPDALIQAFQTAPHPPLVLTPYRNARVLNATTLNRVMHDQLTHEPAGFALGEPIILKENGDYRRADSSNATVYLPNGTLGTITGFPSNDTVTATVPDPAMLSATIPITLFLGSFGTIWDWAYVTTVHAAQGGQAPVVILLGSPQEALTDPRAKTQWELHMLYTALSRLQDRPNQFGQVICLGTLDFRNEIPNFADPVFNKGWVKGWVSPDTLSL